MKTLQKFHHLSGLKANIGKTKFYNIDITDFDDIDMQSFKFSNDMTTLIGITITKEWMCFRVTKFQTKIETNGNYSKTMV